MKLEDSSASYTNSAAHVIENLRADFNTFTGVEVNGTGNIVRGNQVVNTGGSTVSTNSYAITARGPGARVLNNDVIGTVAANSYGIYVDTDADVTVSDNRLSRLGNGIFFTGASGSYMNDLVRAATTL